MKPYYVVEAALFSAGRAVSVDEIMQETDLERAQVEKAIKQLVKAYEAHDTCIEVSKAGAKWAMQVKPIAAEPAARFAQMEIAPKLLKTLALIAYHQPMKQSELVDMIGTRVYDHIPELKERGLVKTRRDGSTKILSTTSRFPEYFGLDAASPEEIRQVLGKLVGMEHIPKKQKREKELASYGEPNAVPDQEGPAQEPSEAPTDAPRDADATQAEAATPSDAVLAATHDG